MKKIGILNILVLVLTLSLVLCGSCYAEEDGVGHYAQGALADFMDVAAPGFAPMNWFNYYNGTAGATVRIPTGGLLAANLDMTTYCELFGFVYTTPFGMLGGKYAFGALIPYVWADVKGQVSASGKTINRSDTVDGMGDVILIPVWLAWNKGFFKWDTRLLVYAPTGEYEVGQLANVGLNFWTFTPVVSLSYFNTDNGFEISAYTGIDFNTENNATRYLSGDVFHIDFTVAEHLPLFGGFVGLGANAWYWEQISRDTGPGAVLGSFETSTCGIGPVLSYMYPMSGHYLLAEVKWLPEADVRHKVKGDSVWFKLVFAF